MYNITIYKKACITYIKAHKNNNPISVAISEAYYDEYYKAMRYGYTNEELLNIYKEIYLKLKAFM